MDNNTFLNKAMTQEEKLEKAKELYPTANADQRYVLECLFPELAESEDERIRKAIKYCIKQGFIGYGKIENVTPDECLAWLEKQGEQRNKINSCKITFEDVLALECSMKTAKITKGGEELYKILVPLYNKIHNAYLVEKQCEQNTMRIEEDEDSNVNDETNAPIEYGKYVDECLNEASKHFFSEGENKYSVADLFYAGVRCGKSCLEKQVELKEVDLELNSFDATVCKIGSTYLKEMDRDAIAKALESYKDGDKVKVIIKAKGE